jgi:hypothetical protein
VQRARDIAVRRLGRGDSDDASTDGASISTQAGQLHCRFNVEDRWRRPRTWVEPGTEIEREERWRTREKRTKPRSCLSLRSCKSRNSGECDSREDVNGEAREDEHHFTDNLRLDSMIYIQRWFPLGPSISKVIKRSPNVHHS